MSTSVICIRYIFSKVVWINNRVTPHTAISTIRVVIANDVGKMLYSELALHRKINHNKYLIKNYILCYLTKYYHIFFQITSAFQKLHTFFTYFFHLADIQKKDAEPNGSASFQNF